MSTGIIKGSVWVIRKVVWDPHTPFVNKEETIHIAAVIEFAYGRHP